MELRLGVHFLNGVVGEAEVQDDDFVWVLEVKSGHLGQLHLDLRGLDAFALGEPLDLLLH